MGGKEGCVERSQMMRFENTRGEVVQRDTIAPVLNSLTDTTALSVGEVSLDTSGCKATTICTDNALGQSHCPLLQCT